MEYKNYKISMSAVYKMERGEKIHSLMITDQAGKCVFESPHIYREDKYGRKEAMRDAKAYIRQATEKQRCGLTEIEAFAALTIKRECIDREEKRTANWESIKKVTHGINAGTSLLLCGLYISQFFFLHTLKQDVVFIMLGVLYSLMGLIFMGVAFAWGVCIKGGFRISDNSRRALGVAWWLRLFLVKGPITPYPDQPFENKKAGWYSSTPLIAILFEALFGIFLLFASGGWLLVSTILSMVLLVLHYFFCCLWEIAEEKLESGTFPFQRVFVPLITIAVMLVFVFVYMKIVY